MAFNFFKSEPETQPKDSRAEELSECQQLLAAFSGSMAIIEFTPDGTVLTANDNFQKTMGYSLPELIGKHHRLFCDQATQQSASYKAFWQQLAAGQAKEGQFSRVAKNGKCVYLEASYCPVKDHNGKVYKVVKLASDITERVLKTNDLQSLYQAISRSMAVIEFTPTGQILTANDNFLATSGYQMQEIQGQHHRIFCDKSYVQSSDYQAFWQRLADGEVYSGRIERRNKAGEAVWLEATYNPVMDCDGTIYKVVKFASDITESVVGAKTTSETAYQCLVESESLSNKGESVVNDAIAAMDNVNSGLSKASERINSLNEQSEQISNIVSTITAIADQTNLLALNAAIEAARAGEQGRGFAVVADEVRNLAARTSNSTAEIETVVKRNQQFANDAVQAMEGIVTESEKSVGLIRDTGDTVREIGSSTKEMVQMIGKLADAASQ